MFGGGGLLGQMHWQVAGLLFLFVSGCSFGPNPPSGLNASLNCVDDSANCLRQRRAALTRIMSDPSAKWINEPPTANADASGVRLFAYKKRKRQLSCGQLRIGYAEAKGARQRLRASSNQQLTPALISRGALLGDEVAGELRREMRRRGCKAS